MSVLTKKRRRCAELTNKGKPCGGYVLSKQGVEKLLDAGISLVSDPTQFCSFHARTIEERYEMQARGGAANLKRVREGTPEPERVVMPKEIAGRGYMLIRQLLDAKLPGTNESDARKVALGCYLASQMYTPAETATKMLWQLLPRDLQQRRDLTELAEAELHEAISALSDEDQRQAWQLLGSAA